MFVQEMTIASDPINLQRDSVLSTGQSGALWVLERTWYLCGSLESLNIKWHSSLSLNLHLSRIYMGGRGLIVIRVSSPVNASVVCEMTNRIIMFSRFLSVIFKEKQNAFSVFSLKKY